MIFIGTLFCNLHRDANGLYLRQTKQGRSGSASSACLPPALNVCHALSCPLSSMGPKVVHGRGTWGRWLGGKVRCFIDAIFGNSLGESRNVHPNSIRENVKT